MTDGTRPRGRLLYPLVDVASLMLVALSSFSLAALGHDHVINAAMDVALGDDQATVRQFVESNLTAADLEGGLVVADRRLIIEPLLADLVRRHGYRDVAIVLPRPSGALAASAGGSAVAVTADTIDALSGGRANTRVVPGDGICASQSSLTEAIPIVQGADVRLVFQIRRDATPILVRADEALRDVVIVTLSAAVVLAALLYTIFRAANSRLRKQEAQLADSRQRDPLTGLLNHGAAVAALTELVEVARGDDTSIGIPPADFENFRLLNDVHGSTVR